MLDSQPVHAQTHMHASTKWGKSMSQEEEGKKVHNLSLHMQNTCADTVV